ncbi:MAG: IPT/TIG domain-containing protein [Acidobacteriota bacterium]
MNERLFAAGSRRWILALCLCLAASSAGLQAQSGSASQFLFPRFVSNSGASTGITIFNPNSGAATITLTFRGRDGKLVANVSDPITLTVHALGQVAKTAGELFGAAVSLDGSLAISSSAAGLVAIYQTFDPPPTFIDGSDAAEASLSLVFPVIPGSTEGISEIDLANPNLRDTSVDLKLWSLDGKLQGAVTITVPGGGTYHNLAQNVFPPGTSFSRASHITATSKARNVLSAAQSVAGASLFAGFSSSASLGGTVDLAALNAVPLTQASNSGVIPFFRTGGQDASTLALVNLEPVIEYVSVTAVSNNGSTLGAHLVTLKPQGGLRAPVQSIITEIGSHEQEGWLLLQSSGRMVGNIIYGRGDAGSLTAIPVQRTPKAEFVFPKLLQGSGFHTDFTLVNPTPVTSTAEIQIIAGDGVTVAANQITLGPSQRESISLSALLPEVGDLPDGVVHVVSNGALFAAAEISSDSGSITWNVAPEDTSFLASPLNSFAVTGIVTVNDKPAAGFRVALAGPVEMTTTSGEMGTYVFRDLPQGSYSMAVDQFGFQFAPAQATFDITDASKRQNFQGFTAANGILVQPDSLRVGSQDTTVTIFGRDFNPTSQAFVDSLQLLTTFVDSTQLQAVVPAYLMASASIFNIAVVTNGSGVSPNVSQTFAVVAYQDKPVLTKAITSGALVEGGPAGNVTLQGTGFLEGAVVKVNGASDGIQVTVISDAEIVVYLPAPYLEHGGIYPVSVENPYPAGAESNVQLLVVYYPPPAVEAVLPGVCSARLELDAGPLNIDVLGFGFRRGAVVLFNDLPLVTSYCETDAYCLSTHLFAKIPAGLLRKAGFGEVRVQNPDPSVANSEVTFVRIDGLQPTITSVLSGSATIVDSSAEFSMPIIVEGTNFGPDTSVQIFPPNPGDPPADAAVELISSIQLVVWITVSYPDSLGEWTVQVTNSPPGGGSSDAVSFLISEGSFVAEPFLTSLSPRTVAPGGPSFTLTINGCNLKPGAVINFDTTPLVTTVLSTWQVRAVVPASLILSAGRIPISVTNPDDGGTSNWLFLDIR